MKNKSNHDRDDRGPQDPHEMEEWADRAETIRLLRHLVSFTRSEQGSNVPHYGFTIDRYHRAKALIVHVLRRRRRYD